MDKKLNLNERLDFSDIDLTAPEKVIEDILSQLPAETNGIVLGEIKEYDGHVTSYTKPGLSSITTALGTMDKEVDIQKDLGKIGLETHKYECVLYTPQYDKYKYRMFFVRYGIANYPVDVILQESVARSISGANSGYIITCNTRDELEGLVVNVLTSKKIISVMQELIRINQAKKDVVVTDQNDSTDEE